MADIIPDLIEIGVDTLNLQLFCMDIEKIAECYYTMNIPEANKRAEWDEWALKGLPTVRAMP